MGARTSRGGGGGGGGGYMARVETYKRGLAKDVEEMGLEAAALKSNISAATKILRDWQKAKPDGLYSQKEIDARVAAQKANLAKLTSRYNAIRAGGRRG